MMMRAVATIPFFALAGLLFFGGCAHQPPDPNRLQAGLAEIDITPPVGYRMAGYFEERASTGVHDPLQAKAIVLQEGSRRAVLVFCDLLEVSLHVSREARARASRATGIPETNIVIAATHSHTGPLYDDIRRDQFHHEAVAKFGRDPKEKIDYPAFLIHQLVKVIAKANSNLQPADLDEGVATQPGTTFNRRYHMKNGTVVFNPGLQNPKVVGPAGPTDPDVGILLFKYANRPQPVGGLTVFAMHPDTINGTIYSADYPYFIQQTLRGAFGSNFISVFGTGTCGDLNHIDVTKKGRTSGIDIAEKLGDRIGQTVLADLPKLQPVENPDLAVKDRILMLPLQTVTPEELAKGRKILTELNDPKVNFYDKVRAVKAVDLARRGANWPFEVQVFRLNSETAIVCLPAEIFVEFGLAIKKASPFKQTMVVTLCNERPDYVPTLKAFQEGSYEIVNSRVKPGGGEAMVEAAIKMLNELKGGL